MNWRSRKLLDRAKDAPHCMCCHCHGDGTNLVAAHSNQLRDNKGRGIKADDYRIAFLCHVCHTAVDQGSVWSAEQKRSVWEEAHRESMGWLIENRFLKVV